ncbi:hypothetical protein A262_11607, partial [Pseudomonas syringae pv. actinidiae ICMP 19073]
MMAQCFQSVVAVLKIPLCLPLMLAISPPLLAEVNPELIAYKIREECRGYSDILVYRLKINFSHACVLIAARARWILFKISSPLAFQ